jgi:hypothetical protein
MPRAKRRKPPKHLPKRFTPATLTGLDACWVELTPRLWVGYIAAMLYLDLQINIVGSNESRRRHTRKYAPHVSDVMTARYWEAQAAGGEVEEDFRADIAIALHKDAGTPDLPDDPQHRDHGWIETTYNSHPPDIIPALPKVLGLWPSIYKVVNTVIKGRFGITVSDDTMKKYVDEWRAFARSYPLK